MEAERIVKERFDVCKFDLVEATNPINNNWTRVEIQLKRLNGILDVRYFKVISEPTNSGETKIPTTQVNCK